MVRGVCPQCPGERLVHKGAAAGKPHKRCKQCGDPFTRTTPRGKPLATKITAVLWYVSGLSMHRMAFLLRVSTPAVLTWIRDVATASDEKPATTGRIIVLQRDAMGHSLKNKRGKLWRGKALDRDMGQLLEGGMWATRPADAAEEGRAPRAMGRHNVLHGQEGSRCVGHPTGHAGAEPSNDPGY